MDLLQDLKELQINIDELKQKFSQLEGTRLIKQYETPEYVFTLSKTFKPKIKAYGITNRCQDGKFILFLEYDRIYKEIIYKNLDVLMNQYPGNFSNFYIAKTQEEEFCKNGGIKGNYHVINFTKHNKEEIQEYLNLCDIDPNFKRIPEKTAHKCNVLRISEKFWKCNGKIAKEKPEYIEIYPKKNLYTTRESSYPHYTLFKKEWKILLDPFYNYQNWDNCVKAELHRYSTPKKEEEHGKKEKT